MSKKPHITAFAYDKRGRLISVGTNSYIKTHPLQAKFAKRAGMPEKIFLHAEVAALLKAGKQEVHRLEVVRLNRKGEPLLAKPCASCRLVIKEYGVKEVTHT